MDPSYQRKLSGMVDDIGNDFDRTLVGTIISSERKVRKGQPDLAVIDGQTRWSGAVLAGEEVLPALIFVGLSPADEARIFADIQTKRRNLSSWQRFNAQVIADTGIAVPIQRIVEDTGFVTGNANAASANPLTISAVAAMESVYAMGAGVGIKRARQREGNQHMGQITLARALRVIKQAWPSQEKGYISGEMIRGLGAFLTRNEDVDDQRLIRRLQATTPVVLIHRANQLREGHAAGGSGARYLAEAILAEYSKRK